jgi:hypothetical protein
MLKNFDPENPEKGVYWTDDYRTEMPIFLKKEGPAARQPQTITEMWAEALKKYSSNPALTFEVKENVWKSISYQ